MFFFNNSEHILHNDGTVYAFKWRGLGFMISCKNKKILHIMNVNVFRVVAEDYFDRPSVCIYVRLHVYPFAFMSVCTYVRLHVCS